MPSKMNAAVVEQFGKPLTLKEVDVPAPAAGQILVKTEACGVCHTDLHAAHGDWPIKPTLPFIPGHEAIGLVVGVGAGVTIVKEGDRVGVPWQPISLLLPPCSALLDRAKSAGIGHFRRNVATRG